jgi:hypothetical protein
MLVSQGQGDLIKNMGVTVDQQGGGTGEETIETLQPQGGAVDPEKAKQLIDTLTGD